MRCWTRVHLVEDAGVEVPFIEVLDSLLDWSTYYTSKHINMLALSLT
jgi:hypothetical protein